MRYLDPEIVKAHEDGLIHFHDADYFAQHMHNCFKSNTRFVTDSGVKEFRDFNDGETVKVVGSDGKWHTATVKKYGKQKMQDVMLQAGRSVKHVFCTANHRWLLNDGSVTTELKEGMTLAMLPELSKYEMESKADYQAWATGFAIGDGLDKKNDYTTVRLCGNKIRYADNFVKAGDTVEIKESCKSSDRYKAILESTAGRLVPEWIDVNQEALSGTVKELPRREAIDVPVNEMLIVELYSK